MYILFYTLFLYMTLYTIKLKLNPIYRIVTLRLQKLWLRDLSTLSTYYTKIFLISTLAFFLLGLTCYFYNSFFSPYINLDIISKSSALAIFGREFQDILINYHRLSRNIWVQASKITCKSMFFQIGDNRVRVINSCFIKKPPKRVIKKVMRE